MGIHAEPHGRTSYLLHFQERSEWGKMGRREPTFSVSSENCVHSLNRPPNEAWGDSGCAKPSRWTLEARGNIRYLCTTRQARGHMLYFSKDQCKGYVSPYGHRVKQDTKCVSSQDKPLGELCLWEWKLELLHTGSSLLFLQVQPKRQLSQGEVLGPSWLEARGFPRPPSLIAASFITGQQGHTHVSQRSISASN